MVYNPFNILLNSACYRIVEDFCINVHKEYCHKGYHFLFLVSLPGFSIKVMLA